MSDAGTEIRLAEEAVFRLRALRLIAVTADGVVPLPASGRYRAPAGSTHHVTGHLENEE
jgi:hypothetical protein